MINKNIYDILKKAMPANDIKDTEFKDKDRLVNNTITSINKSGNITIISGGAIAVIVVFLILCALLFFQQTILY